MKDFHDKEAESFQKSALERVWSWNLEPCTSSMWRQKLVDPVLITETLITPMWTLELFAVRAAGKVKIVMISFKVLKSAKVIKSWFLLKKQQQQQINKPKNNNVSHYYFLRNFSEGGLWSRSFNSTKCHGVQLKTDYLYKTKCSYKLQAKITTVRIPL